MTKAKARRSTRGGPTAAMLALTTKAGGLTISLCNPAAAAARIKSVDIIRQAGLEVSDHAPAILDLDL